MAGMNACLALGPHGPHVLRLSTTTPPTLGPCLVTDGYLHSSGGRGAFPEGSTSYQSLPTRSCMSLLSPPGVRPQGRTTLHKGPCLPNSGPSPGSPCPLPLKYAELCRSSGRMGFALCGAESALGNHRALHKAGKRSLSDRFCLWSPSPPPGWESPLESETSLVQMREGRLREAQ